MNRNSLLQASVLAILLSACAKDKFDPLPPAVPAVSPASTIRLFNFYNTNADITVNNIPLTNYGARQATAAGLGIFPSGTWPNQDDGSPFTIPVSLVDKQGNAHIQISPSPIAIGYNGSFALKPIDTVLYNDPLHPRDYYILTDGSIRVLPRNATAPSQPDHFKIRIINLMINEDNMGYLGKVTLTYADGSIVDPKLSGIDSTHTSDYVELPLGAYQLKLFMSRADGSPDFTRQLAELPVKPNHNGFDQTPGGQPKEQESLFPKIRTFRAGATYSLVITKNVVAQNYGTSGITFTWAEMIHAYRWVTEQSQGANGTYACMDAVNAINTSGVTISVDGQPLGSNLSFGQYAGDKVYVWGNHHVEARDGQGNVLAQKDIMMYANDYLTAWCYTDSTGKNALAFSSTDMTSTLYKVNQYGYTTTMSSNYTYYPVTDDGTDGSIRIGTTNYNWQSRFLNLCQDLPYATFGQDMIASRGGVAGNEQLFIYTKSDASDSASFASATINLGQGITNATQPFLMYQAYGLGSSYNWTGDGTEVANNGNFNPPGNQILVFASKPGSPPMVPGQLLAGVPGLKWSSFFANPAIYTVPTLKPKVEPGFYSVALIGRLSDGTAKLIYVKHNR
ncbi:MAG: hypothetical protein J0H74_25580 [Chitinophagaceae bacterium]|nr:hypothetical protein [Chitinophagaceae bacterium]